jgi:hypothetical protein
MPEEGKEEPPAEAQEAKPEGEGGAQASVRAHSLTHTAATTFACLAIHERVVWSLITGESAPGTPCQTVKHPPSLLCGLIQPCLIFLPLPLVIINGCRMMPRRRRQRGRRRHRGALRRGAKLLRCVLITIGVLGCHARIGPSTHLILSIKADYHHLSTGRRCTAPWPQGSSA